MVDNSIDLLDCFISVDETFFFSHVHQYFMSLY